MKKLPWEKRRRIVLIKITTQLRAHWETWNKAEIACLFTLCSPNSSKFPMSFICSYSSSLSLSLFFYPALLCLNCYLTFKASFIFTLLNNWNSSLFQNHMRNPESFLTRTLRQIRLSNLWKCKHCGWRGGVCQVLSRGSLIVPCHRLNCRHTRAPHLVSSCHRPSVKLHAGLDSFWQWISENKISKLYFWVSF